MSTRNVARVAGLLFVLFCSLTVLPCVAAQADFDGDGVSDAHDIRCGSAWLKT